MSSHFSIGLILDPASALSRQFADVNALLTKVQSTQPNAAKYQRMGLKLTLKPGEKVAINGAVIVNGDRRVEFAVENHASILRERDIMQAEEANTPAKRIYLPVMMMALDSSMRAKVYAEFEQRLLEFTGAVTDPAALAACLKVSAEVANENYYKALSHCRTLIEFESERLPDVA